MRMRAWPTVAMAVVMAAGAVGAADASPAPRGGGEGRELQRISGPTPFAGCTAGGSSGVLYPNSEVEPYVAVTPRHGKHAVAVYQQDRWSDGGARGDVADWTSDGKHWHRSLLPFSLCVPGGLDYGRASDPWVSIGPDGIVFASGISADLNAAGDVVTRSTPSVATSYNGGRTWRNVRALKRDDTPFFNDKESVTADPTRRGTAYVVWDRTDSDGHFDGPAYISLTRNGGRTWSTARPFVDTSVVPNSQTLGNIVVVDPRKGTLYDFFDWITYTDATATEIADAYFAVVSSTDGGRTWSQPRHVADDTSVDDTHPNDPNTLLRASAHLLSPAIDPRSGKLYVTYEGSDFSGGHYNQIEMVSSRDGGHNWSSPRLVSQSRTTPAFIPSIAVTDGGTVAVTYYDTRFLAPGQTDSLPTAAWLVTFPHGDTSRPRERRISRIFNWLDAPYAEGYFLGDYQGLAAAGRQLRPVLTETHPDPANRTDIYTGSFSAAGTRALHRPEAPYVAHPAYGHIRTAGPLTRR